MPLNEIKEEFLLLMNKCNGSIFCERTGNAFSWMMAEIKKYESDNNSIIVQKILNELNDISTLNKLGKPMDEEMGNQLQVIINQLEDINSNSLQ